MNEPKRSPIHMALALIFGASAQPALSDTATIIEALRLNPAVPLTGDSAQDEAYLQEFAADEDRKKTTAPLSKLEEKNFPALKAAVGLDAADLELLAKAAATDGKRVKGSNLASQGNANEITPDNVKTMPLGASIWSTEARFSRKSIFDMGVLSGAGYLPNLQGQSAQGSSASISSRTEKTSASSKFSSDYGAAARFGGFQSTVGFKYENAKETTTMGGASVASLYNYATNTIRIEAPDGGQWLQDLEGALYGEAFNDNDLANYLRIYEEKSSDELSPKPYKRIEVVRDYPMPGGIASPKAHAGYLIRAASQFAELKTSYATFNSESKSDKDVRKKISLDLQDLKRSIKHSIKSFYNTYGDTFVYEVSGYSEVEGTGQYLQSSKAERYESNHAGTFTAGYNVFAGGGEVSAKVGRWASEASSYGASSLKANATERPNNGANLGDYISRLQTWLKDAQTGTNTSAALPTPSLTVSFPTPPTPRSWKDDPFAPPDMAQFKDLNEWKQSRELFKDSKTYKIPKWLEEQKKKDNQAKEDSPALAKIEELEKIAGEPRNKNREAKRDDISADMLAQIMDADDGEERASKSDVAGQGTDGSKLWGSDEFDEIGKELKRLKAYGNKLIERDQKTLTKPGAWLANDVNADSNLLSKTGEANSTNTNQQMILDKMMVSSFKGLPLVTVLKALRPDLEMPVSSANEVDGFINTSVLLGTLNRYQTVYTYLNFISSVPESGLKETTIVNRMGQFVDELNKKIIGLITASMSSGEDVSDKALAEVLNVEIVGKTNGGGTDIKKTELYKKMGSKNAYDYVVALAESPDYYPVISKAPGGYLALAPVVGGGYCLPRLTSVKQIPIKTKIGYQISYVNAQECVPITPNTDMNKLLEGHPQSPMFPVVRFLENVKPQLNFVQFVGGHRLVIGRDITMGPSVGQLTNIPSSSLKQPTASEKLQFGYDDKLKGVQGRVQELLLGWYSRPTEIIDNRVWQAESLNSFAPADLSWNYSLWFKGDDGSSLEGYDKNEVLLARIGMYPSLFKTDQNTTIFGRESACAASADHICPHLTYQYMAPYSFNVAPDSSETNYGLWNVNQAPKDNYLVGSTTSPTEQPVISKVSLNKIGNSVGTVQTGGMMVLYPITKELLSASGSGAFVYSSGSSPKSILDMDAQGNSPFDAGFLRALLQN